MTLLTAYNLQSLAGNAVQSFVLSLAAVLTFFFSVFVHEFSHAVAARRDRVEVVEIVLHPFGGLTRFRHEPESPGAEFRIAAAGPAASFVLAVLFGIGGAAALSARLDILATLLFLLCLANFLLGLFNLLPGYPLDGGRVLRAYLRNNGRDANDATRLTGKCGQVIAVALMTIGLAAVIVRADHFTGFWSLVTGLFLFDAARRILIDVEHAGRVTVDDRMHLPIPVDPSMTISRFIDEILPIHRLTAFPAAKEKHLYGILLLADMAAIPPDELRRKTVAEVMRTVEPEHFVELGTSYEHAHELMKINGCGAVAVIDRDGRLAGFIGGR